MNARSLRNGREGGQTRRLVVLVVLLFGLGGAALADAEADDWVRIPASAFTMGIDGGDADAQPAHRVVLDAFEIGRYEVTNAEYLAFWEATGRDHTPSDLPEGPGLGPWPERAKTYPNHPVVGVSWEDAVAYARWRGARLPTEAEWEKAARAHTNRLWPWGDEVEGVFANTADPGDGFDDGPAPVGSFPRGTSPYVLYDMAGNVAEWVADWYSDSYYARSPEENPPGPERGVWRVIRGGSWMDPLGACRVSRRLGVYPTLKTAFIGFRLARDVPEER